MDIAERVRKRAARNRAEKSDTRTQALQKRAVDSMCNLPCPKILGIGWLRFGQGLYGVVDKMCNILAFHFASTAAHLSASWYRISFWGPLEARPSLAERKEPFNAFNTSDIEVDIP
jgi:hypothetical protein